MASSPSTDSSAIISIQLSTRKARTRSPILDAIYLRFRKISSSRWRRNSENKRTWTTIWTSLLVAMCFNSGPKIKTAGNIIPRWVEFPSISINLITEDSSSLGAPSTGWGAPRVKTSLSALTDIIQSSKGTLSHWLAWTGSCLWRLLMTELDDHNQSATPSQQAFELFIMVEPKRGVAHRLWHGRMGLIFNHWSPSQFGWQCAVWLSLSPLSEPVLCIIPKVPDQE